MEESGFCADGDASGGEGELGGCDAVLHLVDGEGTARGEIAGGRPLPAADGCGMELGGGDWEPRRRRDAQRQGQEAQGGVSVGNSMAAAQTGGELRSFAGNGFVRAYESDRKFCGERTGVV